MKGTLILSFLLICALFTSAEATSKFLRNQVEDVDIIVLGEESFPQRQVIKNLIDPVQIKEDIRKGQQLNERPVIGILTQYYNETSDYIMAAYVKFAEAAGARVVPIRWRNSDDSIRTLVSKLNGVLLPGGAPVLQNDDGSLTELARKGSVILEKVKEINDQGTYLPLWGTCLGFQMITAIEAPYPETLAIYKFEADDITNNVTLSDNISKSKLFQAMPQHLVTAIQKENITYNHHHDGVYPETFQKYASLREYMVLGVSYDENDLEYVAIVENKKYPIWGIQFHPEKTAFIWKSDLHIPHDANSIGLEQFIANFFVSESRKNFNSFASDEELQSLYVENIPVTMTSSPAWDVYLFGTEATE